MNINRNETKNLRYTVPIRKFSGQIYKIISKPSILNDLSIDENTGEITWPYIDIVNTELTDFYVVYGIYDPDDPTTPIQSDYVNIKTVDDATPIPYKLKTNDLCNLLDTNRVCNSNDTCVPVKKTINGVDSFEYMCKRKNGSSCLRNANMSADINDNQCQSNSICGTNNSDYNVDDPRCYEMKFLNESCTKDTEACVIHNSDGGDTTYTISNSSCKNSVCKPTKPTMAAQRSAEASQDAIATNTVIEQFYRCKTDNDCDDFFLYDDVGVTHTSKAACNQEINQCRPKLKESCSVLSESNDLQACSHVDMKCVKKRSGDSFGECNWYGDLFDYCENKNMFRSTTQSDDDVHFKCDLDTANKPMVCIPGKKESTTSNIYVVQDSNKSLYAGTCRSLINTQGGDCEITDSQQGVCNPDAYECTTLPYIHAPHGVGAFSKGVVNQGVTAGYECRPKVVEVDLINDTAICRMPFFDGFGLAFGNMADKMMMEYDRLDNVFDDTGLITNPISPVNMVFFAPEMSFGDTDVPMSLLSENMSSLDGGIEYELLQGFSRFSEFETITGDDSQVELYHIFGAQKTAATNGKYKIMFALNNYVDASNLFDSRNVLSPNPTEDINQLSNTAFGRGCITAKIFYNTTASLLPEATQGLPNPFNIGWVVKKYCRGITFKVYNGSGMLNHLNIIVFRRSKCNDKCYSGDSTTHPETTYLNDFLYQDLPNNGSGSSGGYLQPYSAETQDGFIDKKNINIPTSADQLPDILAIIKCDTTTTAPNTTTTHSIDIDDDCYDLYTDGASAVKYPRLIDIKYRKGEVSDALVTPPSIDDDVSYGQTAVTWEHQKTRLSELNYEDPNVGFLFHIATNSGAGMITPGTGPLKDNTYPYTANHGSVDYMYNTTVPNNKNDQAKITPHFVITKQRGYVHNFGVRNGENDYGNLTYNDKHANPPYQGTRKIGHINAEGNWNFNVEDDRIRDIR